MRIRSLGGLALLVLLWFACPDWCRAAGSEAVDHPQVVVGYLPSYRAAGWSAERIGPVTDLVLFSITPNRDGSLNTSDITPAMLAQARAAREAAGCRVLVCIGGWERSSHFAAVATDDDLRGKLTAALTAYCEEQGLDGVDFDWEHPRGPRELAGYQALLRETAAALAESQRLTTVAVAPWVDIGRPAYEAVSRVHLMSYDHHHPQATFEKSRQDVARVLEYGIPREKIALGIPFYGRNETRQARTYARLAPQAESHETDVVSGFAFNGPATVRAKVRWAREQGLAGVMIWELGQDTTQPANSLLHAISEEQAETP